MAKKIKNQPEQAQEQTFSFRMILRKPSCLKADGSFDTAKLRELIAAAKAGDQEAKVRLYEQYQYQWRKIIAKCKKLFEPTIVDKEDLQQEAAVALLIALRDYDPEIINSFTAYFYKVCDNYLHSLLRHQKKDVEGTLREDQLCPLDAVGPEGEPLYQVGNAPNQEEAFLCQVYPRIYPLLDESEMEVALLRYADGLPMTEVAQELGCCVRTVRNILDKVKDKLTILNE